MDQSDTSEIRYGSAQRLLEDLLARNGTPGQSEIDALLAAHAELDRELREILGACVDVNRALGAARASELARRAEVERLFADLSTDPGSSGRYAIEEEVGRGGMGVVFRVRDRQLDRWLAMKVVLDQTRGRPGGGTPSIGPGQLSRFLNEARITSQLDHPGIVPVHEVGVDEQGRAYFTMKLVGGRTLAEIYRRRAIGDPEWSTPKVLGLIQRVCEAVAFAHERGVIHRDLKPSNVMVGDFGEVYVMDWGLARRMDSDRVAPLSGEDSSADAALSSMIAETREGGQPGTPAYMSPEQARGRIEDMGPQSDAYSIGAMLYELIAGHPPYCEPGRASTPAEVLARVVKQPPPRIVSSDTPPELAAICDRAMARATRDRYDDVGQLSRDLGAFLNGRVVEAYETGAWAEARKWVQRNRAFALSIAAGIAVLVLGIAAIGAKNARLADATKSAQENERRAEAGEVRASAAEVLATQTTNDILSLSAIEDLKELERRADGLWPADPEMLPRYEAWLADASELIMGRREDRATGTKRRPGLDEHEKKLAQLDESLRENSRTVVNGGSPDVDSREHAWWHAQLSKLVSDLRTLQDEKAGGLFSAGTSEAHGWGIVRRSEFARTIRERSVDGGLARKSWDEAIESIAADPRFAGLKLTPQLGLLPIGRDPDSRLWEFAHLATGDPPHRGPNGRLILEESTGLVFVLIPGGTFRMGAQSTDPAGAHFDPGARTDESPVHEVTLSPYFLSKYEMTQGQWLRFAGGNPSTYGRANFQMKWDRSNKGWTALHPVEEVSWTRCVEVMTRLGLTLPSEAQWENGARGGTDSVYWTGDSVESLKGAANIADAYGRTHGGEAWPAWEDGFDDGNTVHAEVGSYRANAFGLHDVHGNVWEWCLDGYDGEFYARSPRIDPVAPSDGTSYRVFRGGSFFVAASSARTANRYAANPGNESVVVGLRPARLLSP